MWKDTHFRYIIRTQNKQWTTKKIKRSDVEKGFVILSTSTKLILFNRRHFENG